MISKKEWHLKRKKNVFWFNNSFGQFDCQAQYFSSQTGFFNDNFATNLKLYLISVNTINLCFKGGPKNVYSIEYFRLFLIPYTLKLAKADSTKNVLLLKKIYNFFPIITKLCENKVLMCTPFWQSFVTHQPRSQFYSKKITCSPNCYFLTSNIMGALKS